MPFLGLHEADNSIPYVLTKWESQGRLSEWSLCGFSPVFNVLLVFCLLVGFCSCLEEVLSFVWLRISLSVLIGMALTVWRSLASDVQ